ncbi:hypothetical protein AVO45_12565 [Ruegeria marisrubri]|uniref:Uncharacterized protein n=1 Tax=Ruegeria marisrubri TaxID=1685379 RepID=A0A0X3TK72_9RHOB|nr:hypothetical protein AVO45_12565 [Ruegeria marisrubri]
MGADKLTSELLNLAEDIDVSEELFHRAIKRWRLGNPPGKGKNTVGDEVNWECLLEYFDGRGDDLHLISVDGDYSSELDSKSLKPILRRDWEKATVASRIFLYRSLSEFFRTHFPAIKLASEVKLHSIIDELEASRSFSRTHSVVSELLAEGELTLGAANRILKIAQKNNQVGWIVTDKDLYELFSLIRSEHGTKLSKADKEYLDRVVDEGEAIWGEEGEDEIPF